MTKRLRDKEKMRKANNEYRKRNPIKVKYASKKATCKGKGIDFEISAEDFVDWYSAQPKTCHYCGREFKDKFDTKIDRKDARGGYRPGNLVLACFMCNRLKSDIFTEEEWFEIVQKYNLVRRYK